MCSPFPWGLCEMNGLCPHSQTLDDIPLVIALYGDNWKGSPLTHLRDRTSVELTVNPALTSIFSTIDKVPLCGLLTHGRTDCHGYCFKTHFLTEWVTQWLGPCLHLLITTISQTLLMTTLRRWYWIDHFPLI